MRVQSRYSRGTVEEEKEDEEVDEEEEGGRGGGGEGQEGGGVGGRYSDGTGRIQESYRGVHQGYGGVQ